MCRLDKGWVVYMSTGPLRECTAIMLNTLGLHLEVGLLCHRRIESRRKVLITPHERLGIDLHVVRYHERREQCNVTPHRELVHIGMSAHHI
jgi:hypothetical protein